MSNGDTDMDREIFLGFIDESMESLDVAENALIELEADPQNTDLIAAIFRAAHSLKGNSAFFGLMSVKKLAHRMEDLLDAVRQHRIQGSRQVIDALLPGLDLLRKMLENVLAGQPEFTDMAPLNSVLQGLDHALEGRVVEAPSQLASVRRSIQIARDSLPDELKKLLDEALRLTHDAETDIGETKKCQRPKPRDAGSHNALTTLLEAPFDDVADDEQLREIEQALNDLSNIKSEPETRELVAQAKEIFNTFSNSPVGLDNTAREMILELAAGLPQPTTKELAVDTANQKETEPEAAKQARQSRKTLRIAESSLDAFLDHVGELIGIEEMLRYCLRQAGSTGDMSIYRELKQVVEQFCKVSADLRNGIMDTRKVQAKGLLDKAHRLVRDVAAHTKKQIKVHITGTEMRIDKNYAELLDAPLVHMVRNAADHGIEPPEEREQAGKPMEGDIRIELTEKENDIMLTITDDGRGLNRDALTRKALDMGLVEAGRQLSEDDIIRLLFTSGVSTAAKITDISGRGVGMDVVKQAIDAAGGRIRVNSTNGRGSVFTIMLPKNVSTKIIDGYLVRGRDNSIFVLPLKSVLEAFVAGQEEIFTVKRQGRMVRRRDLLHPVLNLDVVVQNGQEQVGSTAELFVDGTTLVLLDIGGKTIALAVNEIVGVQKVVVKSIDGLNAQNKMIEGAAVMGDGVVALILGEQGLARLLVNTDPATLSPSTNTKMETTS